MQGQQRKRRVPALAVIIPVFVLFAIVMAWAIREGRELGLLSVAVLLG